MDLGDVFRRFFGFPSRVPPNWHNRHPNEDGNDDHNRDSHHYSEGHWNDDEGIGARPPSFEFFFGVPHDGREGLDDMFEHFHGDIWRQMESLHRQMEDMMKGFGAIDFPTVTEPPLQPSIDDSDDKPKGKGSPFVWFGTPSPFFGHAPNSSESPRDFMLKEPEDQPAIPANPGLSPPAGKEPRSRTIFSMPSWKNSKPEKKEDTDLDGKLSEEEILSLVKKPQPQLPSAEPQPPQQRQPRFFSSGSSLTFTTIQGADGRVEQKKIVRDSSGHEETIVTRSLGDQSHTVRTITEEDGQQEKQETFQNMDEKDMGLFEEQWNRSSHRPRNPADSLIAPTQVLRIDPEEQDIFSRLFGPRNK